MIRISLKLLISTVVMFTALVAGHRLAYCQYTNSQPVAVSTSDSGIDQYIDLLRKDVRSVTKQIIAANLDLTDDEAVKFWPIYNQYAAELAKINDTKIALIKEYAQKNNLQLKYFPVFRRVLSGKTAARFFQIEWRISLMIDLQLASQMPLIQQ